MSRPGGHDFRSGESKGSSAIEEGKIYALGKYYDLSQRFPFP
jgi:hypothetical protein